MSACVFCGDGVAIIFFEKIFFLFGKTFLHLWCSFLHDVPNDGVEVDRHIKFKALLLRFVLDIQESRKFLINNQDKAAVMPALYVLVAYIMYACTYTWAFDVARF